MDKAEILRIATYLRMTYQGLKAAMEGRDKNNSGMRYIPIHNMYAPNEEEIKKLANYILNNEDWDLYSKTFGLMDLELLQCATLKLGEIWDSWSDEVRKNIILENYSYIRENCKEQCHEIFGVSETRATLKAIWGETMLLKPIFKNLIPPLNQSVSCQENHFCENYIIIPRKESLKKKLHELIDETKGRKSVLPIYTSVDMGLILKPKYKDFIAEFGKIISESEYSKAFNDPKFSDEEIRNMVLKLSGFKQ